MFHYRTGQLQKKKQLRVLLTAIDVSKLSEPQKGFYHEMRTLSMVPYWVPSEYQLNKLKELMNG